MKISLDWLSTFVNFIETNPEQLSERLTESSAEVDDIIEEGKVLEHVVIGKILEIANHPDSEKLHITKTQVSESEILQIVCGAQNIVEGMIVPVATIGAVLPGNFSIQKAKVRGVESFGMLCSAKELGMAGDASGILDCGFLNAPVGTPLATALGKNDTIFDIENTTITNRPDLFSHYGFAREMVANGSAEWKKSFTVPTPSFPTSPLDIEIIFPENASELVPKYLAVRISGVDGATPSPAYMQKRLASVGQEPRNALVDITNYVMFELGTPMHAFDAKKTGRVWKFELSQGGEKMSTLKGEEKTLPKDAIILTDEHGQIFDLCGIQGGKTSGIFDDTTEILLHVPVYDPVKIRRTAIAVDHRTDASTIYEKNLPFGMVDLAMNRAIQLILEVFPNAKITSSLLSKTFIVTEKSPIVLPYTLISQKLGIDLLHTKSLEILKDLGFEILSTSDESITVATPDFRKDISIPEDLVEEIVRIYGLNSVEAVAPVITISQKEKLKSRQVEQRIANVLVQNGVQEILTLAFYGKDLLKRSGFETVPETSLLLKNPLSEDLEIMRTSLSPRLLEVAERNRKHTEHFRIFESGKVFFWQNGEKIEEPRITALLVGDDFYTAKWVAENIFEAFYATSRIEATQHTVPFAHPGRGAVMTAGKDAKIKIFQIHPKTAKEFSLPEESCIVCISLAPFEALLANKPKLKDLPKFPSIDFDLSVLCDVKTLVGDLAKVASRVSPLIESATVQSVWEGKGVPEGQKSVTLSFLLRAEDRTLTDVEWKNIREDILKALEKKGAVFRF